MAPSIIQRRSIRHLIPVPEKSNTLPGAKDRNLSHVRYMDRTSYYLLNNCYLSMLFPCCCHCWTYEPRGKL